MLSFPESNFTRSPSVFCSEEELRHALRACESHPSQENFANAHARCLLHAAQRFREQIQSLPEIRDHTQTINGNVLVFEAACYFWGMTGYAIREANQMEWEDDRSAVQSATLAGLNKAAAIMQEKWRDFYPEVYTLSRFFLYPKDAERALSIFLRLLHASENRDTPLLSFELPETAWHSTEAERDYTRLIAPICKAALHELKETLLSLADHYRDNRTA